MEGDLGRLIAEYGPTSRTAPRQAAAYPFTHLRSDGVWLLDRDVPMGQPAALAGVAGRLDPELEATLSRDPLLLAAVARGVVDAQFPATLADEVLVSCGLDPEVMRSSGAVSDLAARRTRSAAWRASVVSDWDGACAFCGYDGSLSGVPVGIEAAHVRWFNFDGPDDPDNGLALCSLHHKLLDRGVLGLTQDHEVVVSRAFRATSAVGRAVYDLEGSTLTPRPGTVLPALTHIEWHWRQVFRAPALRAG